MARTPPIAIETSDNVVQVFSAYIKDGQTCRVGVPVKLSADLLKDGGLPEIIEATAAADDWIGVLEWDNGYSPTGVYPHQGNNAYHLNPEKREVSVRRPFGIGLVRCVTALSKNTRVVAGNGGVVAVGAPGSSLVRVLGRLLEDSTEYDNGHYAKIFYNAGYALV